MEARLTCCLGFKPPLVEASHPRYSDTAVFLQDHLKERARSTGATVTPCSTVLWVVGLQEGFPLSPLRTAPSRAPWTEARAAGALGGNYCVALPQKPALLHKHNLLPACWSLQRFYTIRMLRIFRLMSVNVLRTTINPGIGYLNKCSGQTIKGSIFTSDCKMNENVEQIIIPVGFGHEYRL